ncbi:glycosyltransferase family protein [Crateriforma conspicua]|uniref:glycosyltransferase family protein n=1 Tax=Crateriforma conspicua TaxID=2527996 RepID=UPI00118D25FE|nr:glycosyltransferase family protein [Crateriforma conspicua]QDV65610.1 hypothetical protein Mal65_47830 [Crateriforma conspicua]
MARIVYSLSGEGRGHATRAHTVISLLSRQHDVLVYAPGMAHELLSQCQYDPQRITLRRLDGLRFRYRGRRLSYLSSLVASSGFLMRLPARIRTIRHEIRNWGATHVINDFEPLLSRVARSASLPLISLDHQHFLAAMDTSVLPSSLARKVRFLRLSIPLFCPRPDRQIISSYFDFPVRPSMSHQVTKVGPLLRNAVLRAKSESGEHLVAYFRRDLPKQLLESLKRCGKQVYVYGLGALSPTGNVQFLETSVDGFLEHLRSSTALVCSSGNQLIGEALHWSKPILAVPEFGNFEQEINGFFLPTTGGGQTVQDSQVGPQTVGEFLENIDRYRNAKGAVTAGNQVVIDRLNQMILDHDFADQQSAPSHAA